MRADKPAKATAAALWPAVAGLEFGLGKIAVSAALGRRAARTPRGSARAPSRGVGRVDSLVLQICSSGAMKLPRRKFLHLSTGIAALPAMSQIAKAQTYPSRSVRIIVGYPPGGANTTVARF